MATDLEETEPWQGLPGMEDAIFDTAIHISDPRERQVYLERSFHGDPEGFTRMSELLEVAGESAAFFIDTRHHRDLLADEALDLLADEEPPRLVNVLAEDQPGTIMGRYCLIRRIGAGGCGIVYEAEQQEPVQRRVALKVIRLGMDTEAVISRFEVERQALALMDHPNIARVLDAGTTGAGRPYFVMELVKGDRITHYCDAEQLDLAGRLALFIRVCHAIQHAHQKGIIHRDIKPSNILVATHDGIAQPKVIDFGIAKATDARLSGPSMTTALDQPVGTPAYMSPEQVDMGGIDIDTRSDVYSLGALLYELLAGRPPFDSEMLQKAGMSEMRRILLEKEPVLPSVSLTSEDKEEGARIAACRRTDGARLVSRLQGDLDWIVARAMEKDRNRRYQTANSLAMDVQRFLCDEPVIARRPGRLYLIGKFVRRNRGMCLSAAAIAISLLGGLGAATMLYLRERSALIEQERLRVEAENSRAEEIRLRREAQARGNVSRVAVLLSEGKLKEADLLLQQNPLSSIDPSPEAAGVFRSLGSWYAVYGRWEQALQCFTLLDQANRLDSRSSVLEGLDLLSVGPAYVEYGDLSSYGAFRKSAVDRYVPVRNSLEAEHLLKACLLTPADKNFVKRLEQVARMCESRVASSDGYYHFREWEAFSLALYYLRLGDWEKTLDWTRESSRFQDTAGSRIAAALCISSMAHRHLGQRQQAIEDLKQAREMIPAPPNASEESQRPLPGTWLSWSVARILLREAEGKG